MRLIPVIDLLDGQAVHAVIGKREHYRPVKSVLCDTPDPFEVATAFRDRLGLNEIYIADLDAIQGARQVNHREMIAALAGEEDLNIILDTAQQYGIPLPSAAVDAQLFNAMLEMGMGELDNSAVLGVFEILANTKLFE